MHTTIESYTMATLFESVASVMCSDFALQLQAQYNLKLTQILLHVTLNTGP